jgi:hypothetical protein
MRIGEVHVHVDVLQAVRLARTMLSTKLQQSADYFALHANQAVFNNQKNLVRDMLQPQWDTLHLTHTVPERTFC